MVGVLVSLLLNLTTSLPFPQRMQLVMMGLQEKKLYIPPPPKAAELPEKVQLVTVGEDWLLYIPPPLVLVLLPEKEQLVTVGEAELALNIPPPLLLALLPEKEQLVTVGEDWLLYIPPPLPPSAFPPVMVKPSRMALPSNPLLLLKMTW